MLVGMVQLREKEVVEGWWSWCHFQNLFVVVVVEKYCLMLSILLLLFSQLALVDCCVSWVNDWLSLMLLFWEVSF